MESKNLYKVYIKLESFQIVGKIKWRATKSFVLRSITTCHPEVLSYIFCFIKGRDCSRRMLKTCRSKISSCSVAELNENSRDMILPQGNFV